MSKLYDEVSHLLRVATQSSEKQAIHLHPDDYAEMLEELGFTPDSKLVSPGSWLLDVEFVSDQAQTPGQAVLVTR